MSGGQAFKQVQSVVAPPPPDPSIAENQAQQDLLKKQKAASTNITGGAGLAGRANTSARTLLGS